MSSEESVLVALGANLIHPKFGEPRQTLEAALIAMEHKGITIVRRSRWYRSAPMPASDQPWFVNGIVWVDTSLDPKALMALLHEVEADFDRVRGVRNAARTLDLDLVAYGRRVSASGEEPELPHPRMAERSFVLLPLQEIAPDWRHPATGRTIEELVGALPGDGLAEALDEQS